MNYLIFLLNNMENKTPLAEEFLNSKNIYVFEGENGLHEKNFNVIKNALISFAKLHVEAALKEANKKAKIRITSFSDEYKFIDYIVNEKIEGSACIDKDSIINSYKLENIK